MKEHTYALPETFEILLRKKPTEMVFQEICQQVQSWHQSSVNDIIKKLKEELADWPPEVCVSNWRNIGFCVDDPWYEPNIYQPPVYWPLVKGLRVQGMSAFHHIFFHLDTTYEEIKYVSLTAPLSEDAVEDFLQSMGPTLEELRLNEMHQEDLLMSSLDSNTFPNLKKLWFESSKLSKKTATSLCCDIWPNLTTLTMDKFVIESFPKKELSPSNFPQLVSLSLLDHSLWFPFSLLPQLEHLHLFDGFTEENFQTFLSCGGKGLKEFSVESYFETEEMLNYYLPYLTSCNLSHREVFPGFLPFYRRSFPRLERLFLENCSVCDDFCQELASCYFPELKELNLKNNEITMEGCQYLSQGFFPKLEFLSLFGNCIHEEGLRTILEGRFPSIRCISAQYCGLSEEELKQFEETYPEVSFQLWPMED